ncbi:hypothetical protein PRIPAC_87954 [Pristionchus pacificus]|nr:hypothetical protein PRIPAC_87954 [Pristionchus pacificus]
MVFFYKIMIMKVFTGTTFYRKARSLWMMKNATKVEVEILGGFYYSMMSAQGDSIYYGSNWKRKIYRAEFKEPYAIETYYLRDLLKGENIHPSGMCSIVCDGKVYVYRLCDDPVRDRIHVDVPVDVLEWLELKAIHRQTAVFRKITREPISSSVKRMGKNAIVLACYRAQTRKFFESGDSRSDMAEYNAPWGSQAIVKNGLVYMTNGESLFTIDPETAELMPPLHFWDTSSFYIAGLQDNTLFGRAKCKKTGKYHLMTTHLPYEYIVKKKSIPAAPVIEITTGFQSKFSTEFEIKKIIGQGGFGCVFQAINRYDHWEYAVKRIDVEAVDRERALLEVRRMAQFDHPNIVRYNSTWVEQPPEGWQREMDAITLKNMNLTDKNLIKYSDDCQFIYIQMQLCNYSLHDWLGENLVQTSREPHRMKSWFKQIVSAVTYIHKRNLIHRDLKPSNILFAEADHIKVCDLGIATERRHDEDTDSEITLSQYTGTWLYMSPEQWKMRRYSSKSDVFTLGLIFAELCTVMTGSDRTEIFHDFRCGVERDIIEDEKTAEFLRWLTQEEPRHRPTCAEMMDHLFLA